MLPDIPISAGGCFADRDKTLAGHSSSRHLEAPRKFRPVDDPARNNGRLVAHYRSSVTNLHFAQHRPLARQLFRQNRDRPFPNEKPGRSPASSPNRNPAPEFSSVAQTNSCADRKFCHLRSTSWTRAWRSIVESWFFTSLSSSESASTWAARRRAWPILR